MHCVILGKYFESPLVAPLLPWPLTKFTATLDRSRPVNPRIILSAHCCVTSIPRIPEAQLLGEYGRQPRVCCIPKSCLGSEVQKSKESTFHLFVMSSICLEDQNFQNRQSTPLTSSSNKSAGSAHFYLQLHYH